MDKLTFNDFEKRLAGAPEVEPDEWDRQMLAEIDAETDHTTTPLEAVRAFRECSGKISLRVPKELHYRLLENAKENGVSLGRVDMSFSGMIIRRFFANRGSGDAAYPQRYARSQ
ncbi:MAG: toxin-antitoxin system HicB family antitoxin [Defluviitaleaceae bacterium]|nr:toxin-antitoxin system HicB family antitoxin [Defluviitaleaceae bacterium]